MRALVAAVVLASLGACGRIAFDGQPADATLDDTALDSLVLAPACGTNILLQDELDDANALPLFMANTDPGVGLTEESGHLDVNFIAGGAAAMTSAYYMSVASYPITDLCVVADFSVIPTNGAEIFMVLYNPQRDAAFDADETTLFLVTSVAQVRGPSLTIARDPSVHLWRLRNQNQTITWDVSANGVDYYELYSLPNFFPANETVQILIGAGTGLAPTTAVDIGRFESIRATGP